MSNAFTPDDAIMEKPLSQGKSSPNQNGLASFTSTTTYCMPLCTRRTHARVYRKAYIRYTLYGSQHAQQAVMYNESCGGMYFETETRLLPGTKIYISYDQRMSENEDPPTIFFTAEVKWCIPINYRQGKFFGVGVQYNRPVFH